MNLEKAIEIKEAEQLFHPRVHDPEKWDANQMSLEALERKRDQDSFTYAGLLQPLPGETEE